MRVREFDHVIMGAGIAGVWLAHALVRQGHSVALVEIGSLRPTGSGPVEPPVLFAERENLGVTQARNHGFTGNSKFWGGGLIRNDESSLRKMFQLEAGSRVVDELLGSYDLVEERLGLPVAERQDIEGSDARLAQIAVLPGRRRDIVKGLLQPYLGDEKLMLSCETRIEALEWGKGGLISTLSLSSPQGRAVLAGRHYVLAMGVIDSNIFALRHLRTALGHSANRLGTRLHDHWSVPIARIRWKNGMGLERLYPPRFSGGNILGARLEIEADCPWGSQSGFVHMQAQYDQVEPYASLKRCMEGLQKGVAWGELLRRALPLARNAPELVRLGYGRLVQHRLFVPDGLELNLVLDFESYARGSNRIVLDDGAAKLYWDIRSEDVDAFMKLLRYGLAQVHRWADERGSSVRPLVDGDDRAGAEAYLRLHAVDAYHLGGGLAAGAAQGGGLLTQDLRFHEIENLWVMGTAAFAAPGIANPVETLLGMCERYARSAATAALRG